MNFTEIKALLLQTFEEWSNDKASRLAASMAYYTVFSIPPLMILFLVIAGQVFNQAEDDVRAELMSQVTNLMGDTGAEAVASILENASQPEGSIIATLVGIATLLFAASNAFGQLHEALNTIWNVELKSEGLLTTIKTRFFSFTMVFGVAFLLLVSLLLSSLISAFNELLTNYIPFSTVLVQIVDITLSIGIITLLFALIYKVVPDVKIDWRDVWVGALVTAVLFTIGKFAIGFYLGNSAPASTYGAAGSLIVILLWVYYSTQILFLGAEFTQVYANKYGERIVADDAAVSISINPADTNEIPLSADTPLPNNTAVHQLPHVASLAVEPSAPAPLPKPVKKMEDGVKKLQQGTVAVLGGLVGTWKFITRQQS